MINGKLRYFMNYWGRGDINVIYNIVMCNAIGNIDILHIYIYIYVSIQS